MPGLTRTRVPERNREVIGQWIKALRVKAGLTQQQLADAITEGSWFTLWSEIERGQKNLPPELYARTAEVLGEDPKKFARVMLRYTNPWTYALLFGADERLKEELERIPTSYRPDHLRH